MSKSLGDIPDDIGPNYVKAEISLKKKQKAQAFLSGSYTSRVIITGKTLSAVEVQGHVYPSQRKSEREHRVNLTINKESKSVSDALCSCQIGQGSEGLCSHGIAVLLLLEQWKLWGYKDIPAMLSCTSQPQQWDKPRGEKIMSEPVSQMIVAKPGNTNRKRKPVMANFTDNRKIQLTADDITSLQQLKGSPVSYLVEQQTDASMYIETPFGKQVVGSALSYHAPLIQPLYHPKQEQNCGDMTFPKQVILARASEDLLKKNKHEWLHLALSYEEAYTLERTTRQQTLCTEWFSARKNRITASSFGNVMTRKKEINDIFLKNTFSNTCFESKATSYGSVNEKTAKSMYVKQTGSHLHDVGLIVNPQFPFLGASPDAIICHDGKSLIMEVKCPYSARDLTIPEAVNQLKYFFLTRSGDQLTLKQNHKHYFQVQGQLLVSGAQECHFVTYTRKDLHIQTIYPDSDIMNGMLQVLTKVYVNNFKPFIAQK